MSSALLPSVPPVATPAESAVKAAPEVRIAETDEFGYVVRVATSPLSVDVDRVDMLTRPEAEAAAAAHGDEVQSDYYLVNDNKRVRRYAVSPEAVVWGSIRMNAGGPEGERVTLQRWFAFVQTAAGRETPFHFDVEAGRVIALEEQYLP